MSEATANYMTVLEQAVSEVRPRLFAIYGTKHSDPSEPVLGWGIEFPGNGGALFRLIDAHSSVHMSDSAQQVLRVQRIVGDVHLKWLDGEPPERSAVADDA